MYKKLISLGMLVVLWGSVCSAEMRVWTSLKGDTIEAEYITIMGSKVALKTSAGKSIKVPLTRLCKADRDYLASMIPPKLKIDVDVDKDRETLDSYSSDYGSYNYEKKSETTKCFVTVEKTNREPCNQDLVGKIYVVGRAQKGDGREVLAFTEHAFSFKRSETARFRTDPVSVSYTKSDYASENGTRYEGYLVVIENVNGEVVAMDSSQSTYEKNRVKFKKAGRGTKFDGDFDIMSSSKNRR